MNQMKKQYKIFIIAALLTMLLAFPAGAQQDTPELEIRLNRDFGYGGFGNDIQGTFTIRVDGPENLQEVHFYLDDTLLGRDEEAPFALQFNTDNYDPGLHNIYAVGLLPDGGEIRSRDISANILSSEESKNRTFLIVGPILAISVIGVLLGSIIPALMGRKGEKRPIGEYSIAGGTVCPRCTFPYSRRTFSPNLIFGKLERCPHCGKWSIRPRASQADLFEAEERLRASQEVTTSTEIDQEDSLRRALDESRYEE